MSSLIWAHTMIQCILGYQIRRILVNDTIKRYRDDGGRRIGTLLDIGCGEGALLNFMVGDTTISRISGVDLREERLKLAVQSLQPTQMDKDFLRETPLDIKLYQGSVDEYDERCTGHDVLTFVEVIEHLPEDVLEALPRTLFEWYRPQLVIITTPNADFNPLFPGWRPGQFRDDDHRFEWSREEFQKWCRKQADCFRYRVEFDGVGVFRGHQFNPAIGHCTQSAAFYRLDDNDSGDSGESKTEDCRRRFSALSSTSSSGSDIHSYRLLAHIEYPHYSVDHTDDEILQEVHQCLPLLAQLQQRIQKQSTESISADSWAFRISDMWKLLQIRQQCHGNMERLVLIIQQAVQSGSDPHLRDYDQENRMFIAGGLEVPADESDDCNNYQKAYDSEDLSDDGYGNSIRRRRHRVEPQQDEEDDNLQNSADDSTLIGGAQWQTSSSAAQSSLLADYSQPTVAAQAEPQQWSLVERPAFESGW